MLENREYLLRVREEIENYYNGFEDEEGEERFLSDYLSEQALDCRFIIESNFEFRSCQVFITLGGPTVWIDTETRSLELRWGGCSESLYLDSDICDAIDEYYAEFYNCR